MSYNNTNKKPSHNVYTVRENNKQDGDYWTKIGVAFPHNDGKGCSLMLEALPLDGKLTIRTAESKEKRS